MAGFAYGKAVTSFPIIPSSPAVVGLYLRLHDDGGPTDPSTSALGPFDELVIRSAHVVGERADLGTVIAVHGSNGRWRPADPELQRLLEVGHDDASRSHISARSERRDLSMRLFDDEPDGSAEVAELGPFSVVDVGPHTLRADQLIVAVRVSTMAPWLLTNSAGTDLGGIARRVLALRTSSARRVAAGHPRTVAGSLEKTERLPTVIDEPAPFVWVDRVRPVQEIYISRPDVPRKR